MIININEYFWLISMHVISTLKVPLCFYDCVTAWSRSCFDGLGNIYSSPSVGGCRKAIQKKKDGGPNSVDGRICT